jgi:S1-C subfamily serine protease
MPIAVMAKVPDIVLKQQTSVVTIYVNSADKEETVRGSGFIIDSNGIIVTNYGSFSN